MGKIKWGGSTFASSHSMVRNDFLLARWDGSHLLRHATNKMGSGYLRFLAFNVPNDFLVGKVG
jgi:hypothetical protein